MSDKLSGFAEKGFLVLENFFHSDDLSELEACVVDLYAQQAVKIAEYQAQVRKVQDSDESDFLKFQSIYELMEKDDKEALYQVQKFFGSSPVARSIFNETFLQVTQDLLSASRNTLLVDGPALFINRPRTDRLRYKWHSEAHYYPKRRRFVNVWFPLFSSKNRDNGTMSFKVGSHVRDFPFSDYQGFNKDSEGKANHFIQYEIPDNFLSSYPEHWCENDRGDLVLFHRSLVHTSNENCSDEYSVAVVARVWDPTDDLTLSGSLAALPYGGNLGRPGLRVDPLF